MPAPTSHPPASLHPHSNILSLINGFDLPEESIPRDNYSAVLMLLNVTQPERVAQLSLKACQLQDFLDKVPQTRWAMYRTVEDPLLHCT
jgi:hypothetical protein